MIQTEEALRRRECLDMALCAIALRAILFAVICLRGHLGARSAASLYDGRSYLLSAQAMLGDWRGFDDFQGRVFPGFPLLIALLHKAGLPLEAAGVGLDWICAGAAAALAALVFNNRRVGWAMVILIPHYLMNSSLVLSEAPLLAFSLAALWLLQRGRGATGGIVMGFAALVRPMACFFLGGGMYVQLRQKRRGQAILSLLGAGGVVVAGLLLVRFWRGDAWAQIRYYANSPNAYGGQLFTWPFHALLCVPGEKNVPAWRTGYIWLHAAVALMACTVLLAAMLRKNSDPRDQLAAPWLWGNTLFALCIGSVWGFECFHRFTIPAQPAMFWALRGILPRRRITWLMVGATSFAIALSSVLHDLPGLPAAR